MKKRLSFKIQLIVLMLFVSAVLVVSNCCLIKCPLKKQPVPATAVNVQLPSIFADHMVLQQGIEIPVWGKANAGGTIRIEFAGSTVWSEVDTDGKWSAKLPAVEAGGPYEVLVIGKDTTLFEDVLVGEVWICSGQSNMEMQVRRVNHVDEEVESANWPQIRMYTVQRKVSDRPMDDCDANWQICTPKNVSDFSAVGYFFGRYLHKKLDVPVGLLHTSWGGTPAESWTSYATVASNEITRPIVDRFELELKTYPERLEAYNKKIKELEESGDVLPTYHKDKGNAGFEKGWAGLNLDDSEWTEVKVPGYWEYYGNMDIDGAIWFRKEIEIPTEWKGKDLSLQLGAIDDFDITYFDGIQVGLTGEETPDFHMHPRAYTVPGKMVKPGKTVIAVRAFDHYGNGGFSGPSSSMRIGLENNLVNSAISLKGNWQMKIEEALDPGAISGPGGKGKPQQPRGPGHPHTPAGLYNAMIYPLAPYAIKGAIWYQGEANADRAYQYRTLLPAMINDWRILWNQGNFPFGIVQLANFMAIDEDPDESAWAELREAQTMTWLNDPNNGMATIIDIGEADDIHPRNKQDVGKRLALWALANSYGKEMEYSGPVYQSMSKKDNQVTLTFSHVGSGLKVKGNELKGFAIAGEDKNFVWAKAKVEGDQVIVWSDEIKSPVAVRYAWGNNPICNLYNVEMLPAVPFRTDDWPGTTVGNE